MPALTPAARVVYVSPHLDDAVLSAGASIALDAAAGREVVVVTVFSTGKHAEERRAEDRKALALLGARRVDLELPEGPARDPRLSRGARLFSPLTSADRPLVAALRDRLGVIVAGVAGVANVEDSAGTRVVAPLGVGMHVDHLLTHAACALLPVEDLAFFEDIPYALCPHQTARRLAQLGCSTVEKRDRPREALAAARYWMGRPFLRDRVPAPFWPVAAAMMAWRNLGDEQPFEASDSLVGPLVGPLVEVRRPVAAATERKLAAIDAYASQWPLFYASLAAFRAALAEHSRRLGSPFVVERTWQRISRAA